MKIKVAYFGMFTALALIFSYVESLIPISFGIPGIKLGVANLMTIVALYRIGTKEAYCLSVLRILLSGLMFGNLFSIVYSLAGGMLSLLIMVLLKKTNQFSVIGVSIAGGTFHNIGQLIVAMIVLESGSIFHYFPVLIIAGMLTGFVIGLISSETMRRIIKLHL